MISFDPATIVAFVNVITLLVLIGGGVFWLGKLSNRVSHLENRVDQLENKIDQVDKKVDQLADDLREEMRNLRNELLEEMRRGNQQILLALVNHSHDGDGQPILRVPVNPE